jgi:hypothetical protein
MSDYDSQRASAAESAASSARALKPNIKNADPRKPTARAAGTKPVPKRPVAERPLAERSAPRGDTDPLVVSETALLRFPKTVVGSSSTRAIVLRNDDARPIALDGVVPVRTDLFHEVSALLNTTPILQPGERREIAIQFRPSRATRVEHVLQVMTGFGPVGPEADIHVSGEGIDVPYDGARSPEQPQSAASSALGTEVRIEEQQRAIADLSRTQDSLAKPRARAVMVIEQWRDAMFKYNHSVATWTLANWIDFLGKTGGDHVLHGGAEVVEQWKEMAKALARKGTKKGVATAGTKMVDYAKKSAKVALALEFPLFGWAIDHALDKLGDYVLDKVGLKEKPEDKSDAHAVAATKSTGQAGVKKTHEILGYQSRANLAISDTASGALLKIAGSESAEELAQWYEFAMAEVTKAPAPIEATGRQFSDILLAQWVLEHAGSTTKANSSTNAKAWGDARKELATKGTLDSLERLDLFVHQCRYEWGSLGLVGADHAAAELDAVRVRAAKEARNNGNSYDAVPGIVANAFKDRSFTFHRSTNPQRIATALGEKQYHLAPDAFGMRIFGAEFTLECKVMLAAEGRGVVVQSFYYSLTSPQRYGDLRRMPGER